MSNLGTGEILIVAIVLFVLFGGKKLPELAKGLGDAGREFNKALRGLDKESEKSTKPKDPESKKGGD